MRARVEPLLLLLWAGGGCALDSEEHSTSGITGHTSGHDDPCEQYGCCAELPDGSRFRCSEPLPPTTGLPSSGSGTDADTGMETGTDTEAADGESGGDEPVCGVSVLVDGGFELGSPHPFWEETTSLPGPPICDDACSNDPGAQPYAGEWFAWFGGAQRPAQMSLSQTFSVLADTAQLRFRFAIDASSGTGDDTFAVLVDGNTVFMRTDADETENGDYIFVPLTLDQWADGEPHELRFEGEVFGAGLTNFFVDEVELVGCGEPGDGTGTSGSDADSGSSDDTTSSGGDDGSGGTDGTGSSGMTAG